MSIRKKKVIDKLPTQRKCVVKSCRKKFTPLRNAQAVCSYECGIKYSQDKKEKDWQKRKAEGNDRLKTHSDWSSELQDQINLIARLIDKEQPCISCQKSTGSQRHGGHRWRTSTFPEIRFHLDNVASQCCYCNDHLSGNADGYDYGLREKYGWLYWKWVHEGIKEQYKSLKLTIPELIAAKARAKKIVKELKTLDLAYPAQVRIELRRKYNLRIGLYKP